MSYRFFHRRRRNNHPLVSFLVWVTVLIFIGTQFHNSSIVTTTFVPVAIYTPTSNSVPTPTAVTDQVAFNTAMASKTQTAVAVPTPVALPFPGRSVSELLTALADGKCVDATLFRDNNNLKNRIQKQNIIRGGTAKHPIYNYTYTYVYTGYMSQVSSLKDKSVCVVGTIDGLPVWSKTSEDLARLYFKESYNGLALSFIGWPQSVDHSLEALGGKKVKLHGIFKVSSDLTLEVSIPSQIEILQ